MTATVTFKCDTDIKKTCDSDILKKQRRCDTNIEKQKDVTVTLASKTKTKTFSGQRLLGEEKDNIVLVTGELQGTYQGMKSACPHFWWLELEALGSASFSTSGS